MSGAVAGAESFPQAIVIGASAGAVEAVSQILSVLPADYAIPIVIVVHLPPTRPSLLAELYQNQCRLNVVEVDDKELLKPGSIYVGPPDYHLLVESVDQLALSDDEPVNYSRPAIDVLFESAADVFGARLVGIVLTGANHDGAAGVLAISQQGGRVLVQTPETALAPEMPRAALEKVPEAEVLTLTEIGTRLLSWQHR